MNTTMPWALPPLVTRTQEIGAPHHRFPGFSDDVSNVLALKPHALEPYIESKTENVEVKPNPLSEMHCVYFEDEKPLRVLMEKFIGKMWFKSNNIVDTTPINIVGETEEERKVKRLEYEEARENAEEKFIGEADVVITDINDTNSIEDSSGGLRRGEMALAAGKIVIFVTGNTYNREKIDAMFAHKYQGKYAFLDKPLSFTVIQETTLELVARRGES